MSMMTTSMTSDSEIDFKNIYKNIKCGIIDINIIHHYLILFR
jgi:hypothetical protein